MGNHRLRVIVGCVIGATFIWLMNAFSKDNYEMKFKYPVTFQYDDSLYVPIEPLPSSVNVNVTGDGWSLFRKSLQAFKNKPVVYSIAQPAKVSVMNAAILRNELLDHFPGLKVNYVVSDTVELVFDKRASKVISLQVDSSSINLAAGHQISSIINMSPSLISIDGPKSQVALYPDTLRIRIPKKSIAENYEAELAIPLREEPLVKWSHNEVYISFEVTSI